MERNKKEGDEKNLHPLLPSMSVHGQIVGEKNGEIVHTVHLQTKKEVHEHDFYKVKHPTT